MATSRSCDEKNKNNCENEQHMDCDCEHAQEINNSVKLLEKIAHLYAERLLSDIILEVDGQELPAHRLILCASSDVFQVMLMNPRWSESRETRIALEEDAFCSKLFPDFLRYLYTGQINVNYHTVLPLLNLADKYNVKDLIKLCINYMCEHVILAAKHNEIVCWLQYTMNCAHTEAYEACFNFIKLNFEMTAETEDYGQIPFEVMCALLKKSDLVVKDEYTLFNLATTWLTLQEKRYLSAATSPANQRSSSPPLTSSSSSPTNEKCSSTPTNQRWSKAEANQNEAEFENLVCQLMQYIRYPNMTPTELSRLLLNPFVIRYKEFFVSHMHSAMCILTRRLDSPNKFNKKSSSSSSSSTTSTPSSFSSSQLSGGGGAGCGEATSVNENAPSKRQKLNPLVMPMYTDAQSKQYKSVPRLYTTEKLGSTMVIENFRELSYYSVRTLVFQTNSGLPESERKFGSSVSGSNEWVVELYPKGVWFRKCTLIHNCESRYEVPESLIKTVRLSLSASKARRRYAIGVLIYGKQCGFERVLIGMQTRFRFTRKETMININDLVPFHELNRTPGDGGSGHSPYLIGPDNNTLKVQIIVAPCPRVF